MNIIRENLPDLTSLIKVTVGEADYLDTVEKSLREYKRKANVPGFRPGMVPMGIVNKMYRKGIISEEAYRAASKACFEYVEKEKINYIGDVMPSEQQQPLDFDNTSDHEFIFELGIAPEVAIDLSDKDKMNRYTIEHSKEMHDSYRSNFLRRFGHLADVDVVEKEEALSVTLDSEAMQIEDAYVGLIGMTDDERAPFIGKKVGDQMDVNINDLYKTPSQRASILQVDPEELAKVAPEFKLTITRIRTFAEPELNDEFFKTAFPEGEVTDEKALDAHIDIQIEDELEIHIKELFNKMMRNMLLSKATLPMPEAFLKRWLFTINEGKFPMEDIERDFVQFLEMMKWNLIQRHYVETLSLNVTKEDMLVQAKVAAQAQFTQYGMPSAPEDMLTRYAESILEDKQEAKKIEDTIYESKIISAIVPMIKVVDKSLSIEEFGKMAADMANM